MKRVRRIGVRHGYDRWAPTYDATGNPIVAMDDRVAVQALRPRRGERILDAGCGTGRNAGRIAKSGAAVVGIDFSQGMLREAHRRYGGVHLALADLRHPLPLRAHSFDATLCALVGEHIEDLHGVLAEIHRVLRPQGRIVFTAYHPDLAAAGKEANFEQDGIEYRLGGFRHTVADYVQAFAAASYAGFRWREFVCDAEVVERVPAAEKYLGQPILLCIEARAG